MILKNLLRRKGRTALTLLGIGLGIAAIVALGAMAAGMEEGYTTMASGSDADVVVTKADTYDITLSSLDEHLGAELLAMPEVTAVAGMLMGNVQVGGGAEARYFFVFGYKIDEFVMDHFRIIEGMSLAEAQVKRGSRRGGKPVIIGKMAADSMDKEVGDSIRFGANAYRVVGIYETGDSFEEGGAVLPLDEAQALLKKPRLVGSFQLKLKHPDMYERLEERLARRYPDLSISRSSEFGDQQQMVQMLKGYAWAISAIAIIIGGVGMTNTIFMSVFERTREIGVLRAVGWRRRRIMGMIMGEAVLLSVIGALLGTALGLLLVHQMGKQPTFGILKGEFTIELFVQSLGVAVGLGAFGGLYPSWRAARLTPLEAMRYDGGSGGSGGPLARLLTYTPMALRNVLRQGTRTALTMLGIVISISAIVSINSIVAGFISGMDDMGISNGADLLAREANASDMGYSAIDERIGKRLAALPEVSHVSGMVMGVVGMEKVPFFIVMGYQPNEFAIRKFEVVEGEPLRSSRQMLLGRNIADTLDARVGQTLRVGERAFRVVGLFETGTSWEDSGAVISLRDAQQLVGKPRQVTMYGIALEHPERAEEVKEQLEQHFDEIEVSISSEFWENLPDMQTSRASIVVIGVLVAVVGGIGMMNTVLMSVLERTREIGVLRAFGWRRRRVLWLIISESLILSSLSGVLGIFGGMLLAMALQQNEALGQFITPIYDLSQFAQAIAIALVMGMVGGIYPAWRATRMSPIEALRYE